MILESLVLDLFKRHVNIEITFSETLTVIRGANYTGKSSLLEGLFFCLFGTSAIIGNKDQITTKGHKGKASAQLVFTHEGRRYYINRTLSTAALNRQLEDESWETVATGHTAVNEAMVEMIGQDRERTLLLSYSRQGETAALATLGEAKLNSIVERVSGAVYADRLIERALLRVKAAEEELEGLGNAPDDPLETMEMHLEMHLSSISGETEAGLLVAEELVGLRGFHAAALEVRNQRTAHNRKAAENEQKRKQLELLIATTAGTVEALQEQFSGLAQVQDVAVLNKQLSELTLQEQKIESDRVARHSLITRRQGASDWITEHEPKYLLAEEGLPELAKLEEVIANAVSEQSGLSLLVGEISAEVKTLTASLSSADCPTCKRPFSDDPTHKEKLQAQLTEAQHIKTTREKIEAVVKAKISKLREQQRDLQRGLPPQDWRVTLQTKTDIIGAANEKLALIPEPPEGLLAELQSQAADLRSSIRQNNTLRTTHNELSEKLETQKKKLTHAQVELEAVEVLAAQSLTDIQEEIDELLKQITERREVAQNIETLISTLTAAKNALEKSIAKERMRLDKRKKCEHQKARFGGLAKWLRDNKTAFLAETWDQMMTLVTEFAAQITNGVVERVLRTDDGSFMFEEKGFQQPMTLASGCQKSVIGAGIRLAMDAVLSAGLGFIVLDEPSSDMDEPHAAALAGALRAQSRQVILVTHREGEEFSSDQLHILE